jgi:hypothetical protein
MFSRRLSLSVFYTYKSVFKLAASVSASSPKTPLEKSEREKYLDNLRNNEMLLPPTLLYIGVQAGTDRAHDRSLR